MVNRTLQRLSSAADLLRPRTLFRTLARVDSVADTTRELQAAVERLQVRTEQLMTIERLDWEQREDLQRAAERLDAPRIDAYVKAAIGRTVIQRDPFPHLVVEKWLPDDVYAAMVKAVPPAVFFADRDVTRQRLMVPFPLAPSYSQRVWRFVADEIVGRSLSAALNEKFRDVVRTYLASHCPAMPPDADLALHPSDGRIMLRRPGYVIAPHRDPKWGFITGLVYLARKGDNEAYGTQLYRVRDDEEAPSDKPFYVDEARCELVRTVPFRPNLLLAFLNSVGAHGASIPAHATPATLERFVYQFRLGPDKEAIARLLTYMPPQRRSRWGGAKALRAEAAES